jgi:cell division protein FtsZ
MHQVMAQAAQALAQIVGKRGLVQLSFADVRSLYGRYAGSEALENCWSAHVEGDIHDRSEDLVEQLLAGPLLADEAVWKHIDHAVAVVSGTRGLGLSDVQELVAALKDRLPTNLSLVTSACLEEDGHDKVRLTLLLAMTTPTLPVEPPVEKKPEARKPARTKTQALTPVTPAKPAAPVAKTPAVAEKPKPAVVAKPAITKKAPGPKNIPAPSVSGPIELPELIEEEAPAEPVVPVPILASAQSASTTRKFIAKQEEMQFDLPTRGRFEKTEETIYNGENLDLPTFRRRGLAIRL